MIYIPNKNEFTERLAINVTAGIEKYGCVSGLNLCKKTITPDQAKLLAKDVVDIVDGWLLIEQNTDIMSDSLFRGTLHVLGKKAFVYSAERESTIRRLAEGVSDIKDMSLIAAKARHVWAATYGWDDVDSEYIVRDELYWIQAMNCFIHKYWSEGNISDDIFAMYDCNTKFLFTIHDVFVERETVLKALISGGKIPNKAVSEFFGLLEAYDFRYPTTSFMEYRT